MKRFYKEVSVAQRPQGWQVELDGRAIKTVGGQPQIVPAAPLAEALAAEWAGQGEEIDPRGFLFRDMTDYALDVVARDPAAIRRELLPYAETDTLCYRADPDEPLWQRQQAVWEPVLQAAEARHGVSFQRVSGIIHRPQPAATLAALEAALAGADVFRLAALKNMASLAASLVIALEALAPGADAEALWQAACLEEEWQAELWGRDGEAEERRARRAEGFATARRFALLAAGGQNAAPSETN